jgi:hypothetical protein
MIKERLAYARRLAEENKSYVVRHSQHRAHWLLIVDAAARGAGPIVETPLLAGTTIHEPALSHVIQILESTQVLSQRSAGRETWSGM